MPLAAVSVDLDEIPCYAAIHGLPAGQDGNLHAVYDRAVPRLEALFEELNVPATFFAIGQDLERKDNQRSIGRLHGHGHEIANHSLNHHYDLTRRSRDTIHAEIDGCSTLIERACGRRPDGFRAPGYVITDTLLDVLQELGFSYDSSVFPCPSYYTAKGLAMGSIRIRNRQSRSILDDPRMLSAPADPYRTGRPYWRRGNGMLELPIGVTRRSGRLPFIGTSIVLAGSTGARYLARAMRGRALVNLELHGIDLCAAREDGLGFLEAHQPDMRIPLTRKRAALESAIQTLRDQGYRFVTLAEAARAFAGDPV